MRRLKLPKKTSSKIKIKTGIKRMTMKSRNREREGCRSFNISNCGVAVSASIRCFSQDSSFRNIVLRN